MKSRSWAAMSQVKLFQIPVLATFLFLCCFCSRSSDAAATSGQSRGPGPIRLASFNIQVFGVKKAGDQMVMSTLVKILKRYDIVVIMEIRDSSGEAIKQLLSRTNRELGADPFDIVISERTGRTSSKEQYAVLLRRSVATVQSEETVQDLSDVFQREPYLVRLALKAGSGGRSVPLTLICLHTEPEKSVQELNALYDIAAPLKAENLVIAGDLNADCNYVSQREMVSLKLRRDSGFHWLIEDSVDTTVKSTNCAYDRLIVSDAGMRLVDGPARVFRFDREFQMAAADAAKVSDHYPVELDIVA